MYHNLLGKQSCKLFVEENGLCIYLTHYTGTSSRNKGERVCFQSLYDSKDYNTTEYVLISITSHMIHSLQGSKLAVAQSPMATKMSPGRLENVER